MKAADSNVAELGDNVEIIGLSWGMCSVYSASQIMQFRPTFGIGIKHAEPAVLIPGIGIAMKGGVLCDRGFLGTKV